MRRRLLGRILFSIAFCATVINALPSRIFRQASDGGQQQQPPQGQFPSDFNLNQQQFIPPPPRQFAPSPQQFLPQPSNIPQQQFIPNGQFLPANHFPQDLPPPQFNNLPTQQPQQQGQQQQQQQQPQVPGPLPQQRPAVNIDDSDTPTTETPPPPTPRIVPPPVDKNVDLDGDGALSLAEVQYAAFVHHGLSSSVVENMFNQVDKNKDGYLTSLEFNEIRPLVLAKAENAALRYLHSVDTNRNGLLSLSEAQAYILKEYGISNRDVERIWRLVVPSSNDEMDAVLFSKLRRRVRGMSIRLARQIMKNADRNEDGHIDLREAQMIAFEQEGIGAGDVVEMLASVDDNNDGELNAPEFADFERIVRARAVETSRKALRVVDTDGSGTLTMDEAKRIAFDHYGFDERTLEPFFAQADENEDGNLDAVEFAGFRSVIRGRAVKNAQNLLPEVDTDGDGFVSNVEAEEKARREDDMDPKETFNLYNVADQDKNGVLDKVELADFVRLVRLSAIKYANDHFREFDTNRDKKVTLEELQTLIEEKYSLDPTTTAEFFSKVDVDFSGDLNPGEIVDFRHEVRKYVADREARLEVENQHRREMAEIEEKLRKEADARQKLLAGENEVTTPKTVEENEQSGTAEEQEDFEEDAEEEVVTTAAPKLKKKKLRKHKDQATTTTEIPQTQASDEEVEDTEQRDSQEKLVRDSTLDIETKKTSENELFSPAVASEDVETVTPETESSVEVTETTLIETSSLINLVEESAEETTVAVFELTEAPTTAAPLETATLKKRRKIKKLRLKTTTPVTEEESGVNTSETTAVTTETTTVPAKATSELTTVPTETTVEVTTISTTILPTTDAATTIAVTSITEAEYEEEEESPTTTTQKPKRRRLRKKPTTTTAAPEEDYEEGEEDETEETTNLKRETGLKAE